MTDIFLAQPTTVRVLKCGAKTAKCWDALNDAVAHVIINSDELFIELPTVGADTWLWWFATEEAGQWEWDGELVIQLNRAAIVERELGGVLEMSPEAQSEWPDDIDLGALGIRRLLTEPQRRDVARMIRIGGGANFSVPGAGKTTMAYAVWAALRSRGLVDRCLVVAPLSAHEAWETEPAEIFDDGAAPDVKVCPRSPQGDVVVMNYEKFQAPAMLERYRTWCTSRRTLVIFDEAHRAKAGAHGVRGSSALALARMAAHRIILTGTPRPNSGTDLENVMELVYPGRGISLVRGPASALRSSYARTTKAELGLPELVPHTELVPMSEAHDRVYDAMVDAVAREALEDPALANDMRRAGRIAMLLLQAATDPTAVLDVDGHLHMVGERTDLGLEELIRDLPANFIPTKLVRTVQLVDEHQKGGTKVVLWSCFRHHIDELRLLLAPYEPAVIDGGVPVDDPRASTDRKRELARFRTDPNCTVLVATPHTLSEGVSLHHTTTHQIHLDRTFNAGMFLQSLDRTHRLGLPPEADCTATYLVAERSDRSDTVDMVVAIRLELKIAAMGRILEDPGLEELALPSLDDRLGPEDVLLGPNAADDLSALFRHIVAARR